ncbi:MAG: M28 family peptidase [Muribaculaceae bacterium]|nr:M28 family peptidase [Muribaculaceae bacterium]
MMCKLTMGGIVAGVLFLTAGCHSSTPSKNNPDEASTSLKAYAVFNSDSAYSYVEDQVALGPRVPGSAAAQECASYISTELRRHGADSVRLQPGVVRAYNGDVLKINNVMGSFNPGANRRILLAAHYDTRPWADSDANEDFRTSPIPGANDGGSGVGVLLEIARQISPTPQTLSPPTPLCSTWWGVWMPNSTASTSPIRPHPRLWTAYGQPPPSPATPTASSTRREASSSMTTTS